MFSRQKRVLSRLFGSICFVLILMLVVGAGPSPTLAQTHGKVIELKIAHGGTTASNYHIVAEEFARKVSDKTGGRVKVTIYPAGSLVKHPTCVESTKKGICDITYAPVDFWPTANTSSIINLHLVGWPSGAERLTRIWRELHESVPAMNAAYKDLKLLWMAANPLMELHFTKKAVRVPGDIKGMKITSASPRVLAALGASPVSLPPSEVYMGLERGVAEGLNAPYSFLVSFKIIQLVRSHTKVDCGSNAFTCIMNLDTWKSLPPDIQRIIDDLSPWGAKRFSEVGEELETKGIEECQSRGDTFIEPTREEMQLWFAAAKPGHEEWIAEMEDKGLPGRLVYDTARRLIEKYGR
ncbi:MAG: TRAP transporter substrate-binding protein DctP [Candidatus Hodarchaeota archaeon]